MSPTAELHDPRRLALFEMIQSKINARVTYQSSLFLWFADLEVLEKLTSDSWDDNILCALLTWLVDLFDPCEYALQPTVITTLPPRTAVG